jgi:hypothetical protein
MSKYRILRSRPHLSLVSLSALLALAGTAQAQEPAAAPASLPVAAEAAPTTPAEPAPVVAPAPAVSPAPADVAAPLPAAAKPKPPPYSLPWQLRPVAPGNVLRLDNSYAFYKNPKTDTSGNALVSTLLGSYKVIPDLAVIGRLGFVYNSPPDAVPDVPSKTNFLNPVLGALYGIKLPASLKLGLFLGVALPFGSGGDTNALPSKRTANKAGISTRSAFDNAMFATDYLTVFPGFDIAYVKSGFTLQAEATLFVLGRVRGPSDDSRVNFTTGLHAGYFIAPFLSVGGELRHQRWLSTPKLITADNLRDTTTVAIGPRFHFKLSDKVWFRPGVSLSVPLDDPMKKNEYKIVQLDLPVAF